MLLFEEILKELNILLETVDVHNITTAIQKMLAVRLVYNDGESDRYGKKERIIYPIVYGLTKKGNPAIRAFELSGSSKRGYNRPTNDKASQKNPEYYRDMPQWKLFRTDRIVSWTNEKRSFKNEKDKLVGLNSSGDNGMSQIYSISPICGNISLKDNLPIGPNPISKDDINNTPKQTNNVYNVKDIIGNTVTPLFNKQDTKKDFSVDNNEEIPYNINKIEAPETKPITKQDVEQKPVVTTPQNSDTIEADDQPVTKNDVNGVENDITPAYKDMLDRIDNLNKEN